jgi:hypothetical protein
MIGFPPTLTGRPRPRDFGSPVAFWRLGFAAARIFRAIFVNTYLPDCEIGINIIPTLAEALGPSWCLSGPAWRYQHHAGPDLNNPGKDRIMKAKGNNTASRAPRASVAIVTFTPAKAAEIICRLEDKACVEAYGLGHLAELLLLFGDHVGTPGAGWTNLDTQEIGNRVEYLGEQVKRHAAAIGDILGEMRHTAERMQKGGAQ